MMAVGGIVGIDAREQRAAHVALRRLRDTEDGRSVLVAFNVEMDWSPDPEVGLRVPGVTGALWDAVKAGQLVVDYQDSTTAFVLATNETGRARRRLRELPAGMANAIYRTATDWAADSTSRKNVPSAAPSPARIRRAKLA